MNIVPSFRIESDRMMWQNRVFGERFLSGIDFEEHVDFYWHTEWETGNTKN
jgi:hypothetical protein